jgi:hypothetical protein
MPVLTEGRHPGEAIMSEGNGNISRDNVVIAVSQTIEANALLARRAVIANVTASAEADAGNTAGSGALTLANPPVDANAKDGVYTVTCVEPATNGGTFSVSDPDGREIGIANVGTAFANEIKFTIADATDFVAGDRFNVKVSIPMSAGCEYIAFDPATNEPVAYSIYAVKTDDESTRRAAAITRLATLNGNNIAWPEDITDAQMADAIQALASRSTIIVR